MPNKYPEPYYNRPPCAQQTNQQYVPYPLPSNSGFNLQNQNMYEMVYPNSRNQYQPSYEQVDNWLPDPQVVSDIEKGLRLTDKMETIEISSKDLSPSSCCSNIDLLLPDLYKNNTQWYYNNRNYVEYPSCSQVNCEQDCTVDKTVKYCSIQNYNCNQYEKPDCANMYNQENALISITDVFPPQETLQFEPCLQERNESSNEGSDIIVEESEEDFSENHQRKFNCVVCQLAYSPLGEQFYFLTEETPLTMSSQKSVYLKLKSLIASRWEQNNYLCSQCLGLINTIDHLELKLEMCKNEFFTKTKANPTLTVKEGCGHTFSCKLCKTVFSVKNVYRNHLNRHKRIHQYLCEVCGKGFRKLRGFSLHLRTHNMRYTQIKKKIRIDAYTCKICNKPFRTKSNLKEHESSCSGSLDYKCRICNKKFPTPTKLKNHTRLKHDKKFTSICSICNIGFVKVSDHKAHMISHSADKKFTCTICEKSYKAKSNLKFHMKFHEKKLPFNCPTCNKGFMRREYLESHMSLHTGERNFMCALCPKKFISQKNLDAHLKLHDGTVKKKTCNVCGKLISKGMEDHMRTHANLKEFDCDLCELRFNTKGALLKHRKRKHENELTES